MTFEEQFAAFSGRAVGGDTLGGAPPAEPQPATLAAVPAIEEVSPEQPWVAPEDSAPVEVTPPAPIDVVPSAPIDVMPSAPVDFTPSVPVEVVPATPVEAVLPSTDVAPGYTPEDEQTDSMLANLDRATESLAVFRQEIGRLVQLQRTTANDLDESRRQVVSMQQQLTDYTRLENELAQERSRVTDVRAKLADILQTLDVR